jgi:hypothetical protein
MSDSEADIFILRSVPTAVIRDQDRLPETYQLLSSAVGNPFRARGINDLGMIEFWITEEGTDSSDGCSDSVWIEPEFLTALEDSN